VRFTALLIMTTLTTCVSNAYSQEARGYVQLAGVVSTTVTGEIPSVPHFSRTGLGGTAFGFAAEASFFLSRTVSIGFEASVPARFNGEQFAGEVPGIQIESRHRDILLSGVVRVDLPVGKKTRIGIETGPTFVTEDTVRREATEILAPNQISSGNFGPLGPETTVTRQTIGLVMGADTNLRMARHLDLVAQLRVYWINRDDTVSMLTVMGLGRWIVQPALGVRLNF
jgi:hypothetical protein